MACPFFVPHEIVNDLSWPHPARLPLGAGWTGTCCASAPDTEVAPGAALETPIDPARIRDCCNLGYATACPHLPPDRDWDAVRFSIASSSTQQITICYSCELGHAPTAHGMLIYNLAQQAWREEHPDPRVRRLAASYLHAYRMRQTIPMAEAV